MNKSPRGCFKQNKGKISPGYEVSYGRHIDREVLEELKRGYVI